MPFKVAGHRERNPRVQFGGQVKVSPEDVIEKVGWRSGGYQQFLLLVTCITIASEAAEVALLSLILPHVKNEFNLTNWETDKVAMMRPTRPSPGALSRPPQRCRGLGDAVGCSGAWLFLGGNLAAGRPQGCRKEAAGNLCPSI